LPRTTPRRPPGAQLRAPTPRRRRRRGVGARNCATTRRGCAQLCTVARTHASSSLPAFCDSNSKKERKKLFFQLLSIQPARATQYVPLLVNRFQLLILLIVQYKYLKSCSKDFILQNLILHTRLWGTGFIPQPSWASDFRVTNIVRIKIFVLAVYQ